MHHPIIPISSHPSIHPAVSVCVCALCVCQNLDWMFSPNAPRAEWARSRNEGREKQDQVKECPQRWEPGEDCDQFDFSQELGISKHTHTHTQGQTTRFSPVRCACMCVCPSCVHVSVCLPVCVSEWPSGYPFRWTAGETGRPETERSTPCTGMRMPGGLMHPCIKQWGRIKATGMWIRWLWQQYQPNVISLNEVRKL